MRLYTAGGMSGYPDLNHPAFHAAAAKLRALGYEVVNPAEVTGEDPAEVAKLSPEEAKAHWQACMKKDIAALMTCDGVALLNGWETSKGANIERDLALKLGMKVALVSDLLAQPVAEAA